MTVSDLTTYLKSSNNKLETDLGTITLNKQIGQGGNGLVYEADLHSKKIAVKFLLVESSGKSKIAKEQRFLAEYFNLITLQFRKSIVRYYDYAFFRPKINGELQHIPMILMELYEGSLNKSRENATEEQFKELFNFLIDSVGYIHANGIIHRDIKPENILIKGDQFILTDFGIASYNPDLFAAKAITKNSERLGNRLFSAPEQENSGESAAVTMDIYAIGQVLQWYATGATHRGTGRKRVTTVFNGLSQYDVIIEKCLQHDPKKRYQNIAEMNAASKAEKYKDIYQDFYQFHHMLTKSFPRNNDRVIYTDDQNKIERMFNNIASLQGELDDQLYCTSHHGDHDFALVKSPYTGRWKFGSLEYNINDIWVHYDSSLLNDFILVHYLPDEGFDFEGKRYLEITVVDNQFVVPARDAETGYAEINDYVFTLSEHQTEYIERECEEGYFLLSTDDHCAHYYPNEEDIRDFINDLLQRKVNPTIDEVKVFERKIRRRKPEEVMMRM